MKVISFTYFSKPKREKKAKIFCIGKIFKPTFFVMFGILLMLVVNLFVKNFFSNITASLQNFVESFIHVFYKF